MADNSLYSNIASFIKIWPTNKNGVGRKLNADELFKLIRSIGFSYPIDFKQELKALGFIEIDSQGMWSLTRLGSELKSIQYDVNKELDGTSLDSKWIDFRLLLNYYILYAQKDDRIQILLKPEKEGLDYCVPPAFEPGWLQRLGENKKVHAITFKDKDLALLNALESSSDISTEICVGYPVLTIFNRADQTVRWHIPLASIPLKIVRRIPKAIKACKMFTIEAEFDFENAKINDEWVDRNIPEEFRYELYKALDRSQDENPEDFKSMLDIVNAIQQIASYGKFDYNPDTLEQVLPSSSKKTKELRVINNTAVIFRSEATVFNRSLIRELKQIAKTPSIMLEKTSLAYVFRNPPLKNTKDIDSPVIPFIECNDEQYEALVSSLTSGVSLIQGPPGTGKSQVAVNIIANCINRNESALFTSRNHAALDAIRGRAQFEMDGKIWPLVNYCVDESVRKKWSETDYKDKEDYIRTNGIDEYINSEAKKTLNNLFELTKSIRANSDKLNRMKSGDFDIARDSFMRLAFGDNYNDSDLNNFNQEEVEKCIKYISKITKEGFSGFIARLNYSPQRALKYKKVLNENCPSLFFVTDSNEILVEKMKRLVKAYNLMYKLNEKKEENTSAECEKELSKELDAFDSLQSEVKMISNRILISQWYNRIYDISDEDYAMLDEAKAAFERNNELKSFVPEAKDIEVISSAIKRFQNIYPAWCAPLLSLHLASPLISGIFDQVIIDEAAQCSAHLIIPAMYRAKRATIVGDPEQFQPIMNMSSIKHDRLWKAVWNNDIKYKKYDCHNKSAYDIIKASNPNYVLLRTHYRCGRDIADYISKAFYDGELVCNTKEISLNTPKEATTGSRIIWKDVRNNGSEEIESAIELCNQIQRSGYTGSIGIISPLRKTINLLNDRKSSFENFDDLKIDTAYGFQGGECDIIIFVLGLTNELSRGERWYLLSSENKNIYNVAISRAKACLIIIGDRDACYKSNLIPLRLLAKKGTDAPKIIDFDSNSERKFYEAMQNSNRINMQKIYPQQCYRGYYFDFAYVDYKENILIDIEIDGERFHFNNDKSRVLHDVRRDAVSKKGGWEVIRFPVRRVETDVDSCIDELLDLIEQKKMMKK